MSWYFLLFCAILFFMVLGIIQFIVLISSIVVSFFPDNFDRAVDRWTRPVETSGYTHTWPTDLSRDIFPIVCHSHNDYWRRIPLYSALQAGCISVEADVWHFDNELFVGHTKSSLTPRRTLRSMYINPLLAILDRQNPITLFHPSADSPPNGVFDTDPSQTLVLLVDFKTDGATTWPALLEQLSPLRERGYLTHFNGTAVVNGPITVVGTGNTPFESIVSNSTYRDVFLDAPLDKVAEYGDGGQYSTGNLNQISVDHKIIPYNFTNSYYASVSFTKSIGTPWHFRLSSRQMHLLRAQIRGAHGLGLKVRYWSLPSWPRSLRNHIWSVVIQEGVDILNVDDLEGATKKEWIPPFVPWWS